MKYSDDDTIFLLQKGFRLLTLHLFSVYLSLFLSVSAQNLPSMAIKHAAWIGNNVFILNKILTKILSNNLYNPNCLLNNCKMTWVVVVGVRSNKSKMKKKMSKINNEKAFSKFRQLNIHWPWVIKRPLDWASVTRLLNSRH